MSPEFSNSRDKTLIALTILAIIAASMVPVVSLKAQNQEVVFRVGWGGTAFDTFNPFTTIAQISGWSTSDVYDFLFRFDKTYKNFVPDLAESWDIVNGTYIVFHLVHNATFTDGVPVTSDDVAYSFWLANQSWSRLQPYVSSMRKIVVIDKYTIGFKVDSVPIFMVCGVPAVPIVPKHIWSKVKNPSQFADNPPIGSGPFKVAEYKEGQYIILVKNPNFFRKSWMPKVDKIVISFYSDISAATNALMSGEVDAVGPYIPRAMIKTIESNPNFKLVAPPAVFYYYLSIDVEKDGLGNPTLRDIRVRQALAHAVNLTYLALMTWGKYAQPVANPVPTSNAFYNHNVKPYKFDLQLANQILDQAGYKKGSDGIRRASDGTPLEYTILVPSNMPEMARVAQQITQWWSKIGVKATVQVMDTGTMISKIWVKQGNKTVLGHDMDIWDWFLGPGDPTWLSIFLCNQVPTETSDSGYCNATYDQLYQKLMHAPDMGTARKIAYEMQEMLHRDLPYIPLFEVSTPQAYSVKWTGFYLDWPGGPFGGYDWTTFLRVHPAGMQTTTSVSPPASSSSPATSSTPAATSSVPQSTTPTSSASPAPTSSPTTTPSPQAPSGAVNTGLIAGVITAIIIIIIIAIALTKRK